MKFIDLFCGIGGFRMGFESNGFECVFSADFDVNCQKVYQNNFGEFPFGDITQINPKDIPDFDVLLGGFPCQPFSISGKKLGFDDIRGNLFFDIFRIINKKKPRVVVLENVQHLVHHNGGKTIKVIVNSLEELGYNVSKRVLNSNEFGLPQNRERIFIIGSEKGYFDFDKLTLTKSKPLKNFLDKKGNFEFLDSSEYTLVESPRRQPISGLIFVGYRNKKGFTNNRTLHLSRVHRQPNRIYSVEGYHPTLTSQETNGRFFIYLPKINKVRKLTIDECYRIMGFPESYKKHESLGVCYKQIGNSVSVNVIKEISKGILEQNLLSK